MPDEQIGDSGSNDDVADNDLIQYNSLGCFKDYYNKLLKKLPANGKLHFSSVFVSTARNNLIATLTILRMQYNNTQEVMRKLNTLPYRNIVKDQQFLKQLADGQYDFDMTKFLSVYGNFDVLFSTYKTVPASTERAYSIIIQKVDHSTDTMPVSGFLACDVQYLNRACYDVADPDMQQIRSSIVPCCLFATKESALKFASNRVDKTTLILPFKNGRTDVSSEEVWYRSPWGKFELVEGGEPDDDSDSAPDEPEKKDASDERDDPKMNVDDDTDPDQIIQPK